MKWKPLLFCHLVIALLLGSFLWPATRVIWDSLDTSVFRVLNHTLEGHPWIQAFWAFVNHKKADLVEDAVFLLFFILAIKAAPQKQKIRRACEFLFCILLAGSLIYSVNRVLLRSYMLIPRASPSLVVSPCVRLSEELPWINIKDETLASFPGDHATTLLLFTAFYTFFAGRRLGAYALFYSVFRVLPRLIVGAHWFSDVVVGSGCLALFFLSWTLCTPLHTWIIDRIEKFLTLWRKNEVQKELV